MKTGKSLGICRSIFYELGILVFFVVVTIR